MDVFLRENSQARRKIREVHHEVLFWALNNRTPMKEKKSRINGVEEMCLVLLKHYPRARQILEEALKKYRRTIVARHDILDALAAAVTGLIGGDELKTLPDQPDTDLFNLPREMVYWSSPV